MKIAFVTDLSIIGSGYMSLSLPICVRLAQHHELKVIGLGNRGEEHLFPFSIFPAQDMPTVMRTIQYLHAAWKFDVLIVALDISIQDGIMRTMGDRPFKYVGIFPIESDPLCFSWAGLLQSMDKQFIISEFGTEEARRRHVTTAENIPIGIDTNSWAMPTPEIRNEMRKSFGIDDDEFVVLTVADNQERKNLWLNFKAFAMFSAEHPKSRYILVTRENSPVGWKLRDLALDPFGIGEVQSRESGYDISSKLMIFERGMPFSALWKLYSISDAFLLLSKAEGLGMPLLEAMSVGVPSVGTNCTGIKELIGDGRGILINPEYVYIDPFGNGRRYCASAEEAAEALSELWENPMMRTEIVNRGRSYVEDRSWDKTVEPILHYLSEINDGKA